MGMYNKTSKDKYRYMTLSTNPYARVGFSVADANALGTSTATSPEMNTRHERMKAGGHLVSLPRPTLLIISSRVHDISEYVRSVF